MKSMTQIEAELNMFKYAPENDRYICNVCGNKFKTERGTFNHINRKDHLEAVMKEMDKIVIERYNDR